jgi:phosphopantetheine--protein transferase-like protein
VAGAPLARLAYASTRELSAAERSELPVDERTREFGSPERRRQFLSARALLRSLLSGFDGGSPRSYRITRGEKGKPVCEGGPAISITHAGDYVACCVASSGDVGIDLEVIDPRRQALKVARRFFTALEADWLDTQPRDRFFMLWVLKEAYGKAGGSGVVAALQGLQCIVEPPKIEVLESPAASLCLRLFRLHGSYLAFAAIGGAPGELQVERWDVERGELVVDDDVTEVARN